MVAAAAPSVLTAITYQTLTKSIACAVVNFICMKPDGGPPPEVPLRLGVT